jgi:hypothetical protein
MCISHATADGLARLLHETVSHQNKNMKRYLLLLTLLVHYGCSTKTSLKEISGLENQKYYNGIITDSLFANIPLITDLNFEFGVEADDSVDSELIKLNEKQIDFLYSSEELKYYRDYFGFTSFFYGRMPLKNGLLPILILNTDYSHAIYLDCFLLNKNGEVEGMFNPTYIELDDYSLFGRGNFVNDSIFNFTAISNQSMEDNPNVIVRDSTIIQISLAYKAGVKKDTVKTFSQKIKSEE